MLFSTQSGRQPLQIKPQPSSALALPGSVGNSTSDFWWPWTSNMQLLPNNWGLQFVGSFALKYFYYYFIVVKQSRAFSNWILFLLFSIKNCFTKRMVLSPFCPLRHIERDRERKEGINKFYNSGVLINMQGFFSKKESCHWKVLLTYTNVLKHTEMVLTI